MSTARTAQGPARLHAALHALVHAARAFGARRSARRHARATAQALGALDARALRDLGLDRSEIGSVAAEIAGTIDRLDERLLRGLHGRAG